MLDLFKKGLLAGIGALVLTKEKVQETTRRFVEEGKISTEEAERLADELIRSGERQWDEMSAKINEFMRNRSDPEAVVTRDEFMELRARVELMDQRVILLEEAQRRKDGLIGQV